MIIQTDKTDDLPQELGADDSTLALVAVAVLVCVMAPIAEELFFRGFCFTALRRWIGLVPGALLTGLIFGGIHAGSADAVFLPPLAFLGMALCVLYYRTGSLLPCMVLHAFNNSLALGVSQNWDFLAVIALMAGSAAVVLAIVLPFTRSQPARRGCMRSCARRRGRALDRGGAAVPAAAAAQDPLPTPTPTPPAPTPTPTPTPTPPPAPAPRQGRRVAEAGQDAARRQARRWSSRAASSASAAS